MLGQLHVAAVQLRVIPARFGDARLQIIGHHDAGGPAIEVQRVDVRALPGREVLTAGHFNVQIPAGTQRTRKHLRLPDLARVGIGDRQRIAAEIHEHALASDVLEAHDHVLAAKPTVVVRAELGVAPTVRVVTLVLQPQQLEGDMLAPRPLVVHLEPIRRWASGPILLLAALEEPRFQGTPVQVIGQRPAQASTLGPCEVALNGRRTDADALADLTVAESLRGQAQDFHDPSHRYSPLWHVGLPR